MAVQHLIGLGHRQIAYINGPESWHSARRRLAGYKDVMAAHKLITDPAFIQPGDWEYDSGYQAALNLLKLSESPTAIFAANDLMALGAINALQDNGLNVPKQIAIVGYDNRDFAKIVRPRITTVSMPVYEMGRTAAELLVKQIAEGRRETDEIRVKGKLYIRETCGADISLRTPEEMNMGTIHRRILLNKGPDS
jgi:DNA-binding LacI/PurR family transcriptional regulator